MTADFVCFIVSIGARAVTLLLAILTRNELDNLALDRPRRIKNICIPIILRDIFTVFLLFFCLKKN